MELPWQRGPREPLSRFEMDIPNDLRARLLQPYFQHRRRRRRPRRSMGLVVANELPREPSNLVNSEPRPHPLLQPWAGNLISPADRLTFLDEPKVALDDNDMANIYAKQPNGEGEDYDREDNALTPRFKASTPSHGDEAHPIIPAMQSKTLASQQRPLGHQEEEKISNHGSNSSADRQTHLTGARATIPTSRLLVGDLRQAEPAASSSSFSSTSALLVLLILYIVWQCFRGQTGQQTPKCPDDWPAALLTPSRGRKKRRNSQAELEMQTTGAVTSSSANTSAKCAVLRLRNDTSFGRADVEIVQVTEANGTPIGTRRPLGRLAAEVRRSIARSSLVVAANRAARPRVKLIGERVRRFVDIEAQEAREGHEIGKTIRGRLVRLLHSTRLARAFARGDCELAQQDSAPELSCCEHKAETVAAMAPERAALGRQQRPPSELSVQAEVHRSCPSRGGESGCESLLGFAGSFLERTVNPAASPLQPRDDTNLLLSSDSQQSPRALPSAVPPMASYSPTLCQPQLWPSDFTKPQASFLCDNNRHHNHHHLQHLQGRQREPLSACDCVLAARSKSQTNHNEPASCSAHLLATTSPSALRPCCSVSPSAMARHQTTNGLPCDHQPANLCAPLLSQATGAPMSAYGAHHLGNSCVARSKHPYENYYDDEQEDAYRRLTASIGMQFGLALDQPSLLPGACSMACKCSPTAILPAPNSSFVPSCGNQEPNLAHHQQVPTRTSQGGLSSGESDSGVNFSLANHRVRQGPDSENLCNDSTCSLCQSSLLMASSSAAGQGASLVGAPVRRPSLEPTRGQHSPAALVPRWHNQRRSTLYARQPRRMSIAAFTSSNANSFAAGEATSQQDNLRHHYPQHLLHRASIASDGTTGVFQQQQPHTSHLGPATTAAAAAAAAAAARQSAYTACHFFAPRKASGYSSSAGSSSGIGFSDSQCLSTPTTSGMHPCGVLECAGGNTGGKLLYDLAAGACEPHNGPAPLVCQFGTTGSARTPACPASQGDLDRANNRKFSLPAQLESHAAERMMSNRYHPLFDSQCGDPRELQTTAVSLASGVGDRTGLAGTKHSADLSRWSPSQTDNRFWAGGGSRRIISPLEQRSDGANRRLSQVITRQSSFWLEDGSSENSPDATERPSGEPRDPNGDTVEGSRETPSGITESSEQPSGSSNPSTTNKATESPGRPSGLTQQTTVDSCKRTQRLSSCSSSTSSPSPDFAARHRKRLPIRSSQTNTATRRRLLGSLKQRRPNNRHSPHRRHSSQSTGADAAKGPETSSTDDERDKSRQEDGLSSFDREAAKAELARTTTIDANSTSLERQCRDLWKLRATLHGDDGSIGDNWSNYHQRLNRRYDSGYKSIENQFSSSAEGNVPNIMNLNLRQASPLGDSGCAPRDLDRPRSGCSGLIQEQTIEETPKVDTGSAGALNEETQVLLENCDDQQDEQ